jgi:hypothetical protein
MAPVGESVIADVSLVVNVSLPALVSVTVTTFEATAAVALAFAAVTSKQG